MIRALLPETPTLILMDEVMNYISSNRGSRELGGQFYNFLQNLSEEARAARTSCSPSRSRRRSWR